MAFLINLEGKCSNEKILVKSIFRFSILSYLLLQSIISSAQPFVVDTTFQPFFDIRSGLGKGRVSDIYESNSGKLYLTGTFNFLSSPSVSNNGLTKLNRDGSQNHSFQGYSSGADHFIYGNDTTIMLGGNSIISTPIDSNGVITNWNWIQNRRLTVYCPDGYSRPYFFSNGSSIHPNRSDNSGQPCPIINPPDTFPGRHLIKVSPQGFWDSTWQVNALKEPKDIIRYDSNRLLLVGNPQNFSSYENRPIKGLCRIFEDGTLDTTFRSPLLDTFSVVQATEIGADGSFFLIGNFWLENQSSPTTLVKLNSDGTLDSNFANYRGPTDTTYGASYASVTTMVKTDDNGYLIGGVFDNYQGVPKNNIAKIDSAGILDPQSFTSRGPDSSLSLGNLFSFIYVIKKSKFGGYYVGGDFLKWDGQASQPIIRLIESQSTTIAETERRNNDLKIYPNPSKDDFFVEPSIELIGVEYEVRNIHGKLIETGVLNEKKHQILRDRGLKGTFILIIRDKGIAQKIIRL